MSELACPLCKSNAYLNPSIKIYISPCYHKMCQSCLSRVFSKSEAPCPECGNLLKKSNYISQTFEDLNVERECKLRKRLINVFYRRENEFASIIEYNDYLEEFENVVFDLIDQNEEVVEAKLASLKKEFGTFSNLIEKDETEKLKKRKTEDLSEIKIDEKIFDPLDGVELPKIYVTQKHKIPDCFKLNYVVGGYTENLYIHKAVLSLYDEDL